MQKVNEQFAQLCLSLSYLSEEDISLIRRAFELAVAAHAKQQRSSGEPYISHPVAVSQILADMRMDADTLCAAMLHDVLEDTPVQKNLLAKEFGEQVAELVDGVSKLTQIEFTSKAEAQAENFRKMLLAMTRDIRVILVKLADRLHNMQTLDSLSEEKKRRIARETLEIYAPIANRLGMHNFRVQFEELAFQALFPLRYRILHDSVYKARGTRQEILLNIRQALRRTLEAHGIPASSVIGRQKHLYSIYRKMRLKRHFFSEIMDIYGFRIVVDDVDTCYRALGAIHNLYKPVPGKFKDYIAIPKANGYQSLHTILFGPQGVPIEIQIRTAEMDNYADNGIAAHWLYKADESKVNLTQIKVSNWLRNLLEMQQASGNTQEFIESVKIDLFPDEVYVFTPKGRILELPGGATPVDFAYTVHTDIGDRCTAARINRRPAPLSQRLINGQTVEIVTAPDATPKAEWLNFVVTGRARSKIKHFIKEKQHDASVALGRQLLLNAMIALGEETPNLNASQQKKLLKQFSQYDNFPALLEAIGLGNLKPIVVAQKLLGQLDLASIQEVPLVIKGTEGMVVSFADCCWPIPGDAITGLLIPGEGLQVHRDICHELRHLTKPPKQKMAICWQEDIEGEFKVLLRVDLENKRGVLAALTTKVAETDTNIYDIRIIEYDGVFSTVHLFMIVQDVAHLLKVQEKISSLSAVLRLSRVLS